MRERGIIYVATRDLRFLCEAVTSAERVKKLLPELPLSLFTDLPNVANQQIKPFDNVLPVDQPPDRQLRAWAQGMLTKVTSIANTPYEKTLFLDADTRVLSSRLAEIFDILDEFEFCAVPCRPENSRSCALYRHPMFNTGVIGYRRTAKVSNLLNEWVKKHSLHMDLASSIPPGSAPYLPVELDDDSRRFLLITDQLSFARLLSPDRNIYGVNVKILDDAWNARHYAETELDGVIVDHERRFNFRPQDVEEFLLARSIHSPK
jgi:hypothetical protein